jgi:hypothetical protein
MKKIALAAIAVSLACFAVVSPSIAYADGAAPDMMGVREVVIDYARFADPKAAESCGLSREQIANVLAKAFVGTNVPFVPVNEAKPPVLGVARIELIPEITSHTNETLDCVSYLSLSAENRVNAVIPPVATLRSVTVVYWRQRTMAASNQSTHVNLVNTVLEKMAAQFAQQYRLDQPPELPK